MVAFANSPDFSDGIFQRGDVKIVTNNEEARRLAVKHGLQAVVKTAAKQTGDGCVINQKEPGPKGLTFLAYFSSKNGDEGWCFAEGPFSFIFALYHLQAVFARKGGIEDVLS